MKTMLLRSVAVALGVVLGGAVGGYLTFHRYARDYALVRAFAYAGIFDAVSIHQYNENSLEAKQELLSALSLYTRGANSSAIDPTMKKALRMNCGLLQARLSILEEESGNVDRAKSYLAKAQEDLKAVGWVDHSEANILQAAKRQPVSPCGPAPQNAAKTSASTAPKPCG
jgi:hypothetical protein